MSTDIIKIRTKSEFEDFQKFLKDPAVRILSERPIDSEIEYKVNTNETIVVPKRFFGRSSSKVEKNYTIVLTDNQRDAFRDHIAQHDILAFDIEATGLNVRKDETIGFSISGKEGVGFYLPIKQYSIEYGLQKIEQNYNIVKELLLSLVGKKLITWNGSYDLRLIKREFGIDLVPSLWVDAQMLKHTLDEEGSFALKDVACSIQKYIGLDVEKAANEEQIKLKENVAANGGSTTKDNYEMYKADLDVMGVYAAADADLTLRVANYYLKKLKEEGLEKFFFEEEVMPLYKEVTIPMEEKGVKLDMDLIQKAEKEIVEDIAALEKKVEYSLFEMPEVQEWYQETLDKKVPVKASGSFAQKLVEYLNLPLPKSENGKYKINKSTVSKLPESAEKLFLLKTIPTINPKLARTIQDKLYREQNGGKINLKSKMQLSEIFFDKLEETPLGRTPKGAPQFNDEFVESLKNNYEFAKHLHNYNKLNKIKSSYIDRFLQNQEDGYYYFSYKQYGTISGRYGSDAQQMPRPLGPGQEDDIVIKYTNQVRAYFIAGKGRKFIDSDFISLEPHVFSHVSNSEDLRNIFRKGHDFYSTIAIAALGLYEYSADTKADNYLGELNKQKRQFFKAVALGVPYGLGAYALGKTLEIETDEAQEIIDGYLNTYPDLKKWMQDSVDFVHKNGYIKSQAGRVRHLPQVKKLFNIHSDKLMQFGYRKHLENRYDSKEVLNMYRDYKNGVNNARNFQIQSLAGSIVNRAAIAANREFKKLGINAWCCAQIHDQLIFNVPEELAEKCAKIVQDKMENTTKLSLDLKAPPKISDNWKDGH